MTWPARTWPACWACRPARRTPWPRGPGRSWSGRWDCTELDAILDSWDGRLTALWRKRVSRHIESCDICSARKREVLSPAMLLSVLPLVPLPAGLRDHLMRLVSDDSPEAAGYRGRVVSRAGAFDPAGFPV